MRFQFALTVAATLFTSLAITPASKADIITPDATEYYYSLSTCCTLGSTVTQVGGAEGDFTLACAPPQSANTCGEAILSTTPITSVSATATAYKGQNSQIIAEVAYYYEIVERGPAQSNTRGTTLIPLVVSGYTSFTSSIGPNTSIGGNQANFATLNVIGDAANGNQFASTVFSSQQVAPSTHAVQVNALAYEENPITLVIQLSLVNSNDNAPSSVTGFVDPIISFANPDDAANYDLVFSPGIPNGQAISSAPEPSTWCFMAIAGGALLARRFTAPIKRA